MSFAIGQRSTWSAGHITLSSRAGARARNWGHELKAANLIEAAVPSGHYDAACLVLVAMRAAECQRYLPGVLGLPGDRLHPRAVRRPQG
jgi:hypothetical protein